MTSDPTKPTGPPGNPAATSPTKPPSSPNDPPGREPPAVARPRAPSRKRAGPYVSPYEIAKERLAEQRTETGVACSSKSLETAARIVGLEVVSRQDLEQVEAPHRVFRWVVWGDETMTARKKRTELVLHLRKVFPTPHGGWLDEPELTAAWNYWQSEIAAMRRRGLMQPWAEDLPLEGYQQAIAAVRRAPRRPRRTDPGPDASIEVVLTAEEREALLALPALVLEALPPLAGLVQRLKPR